MLDPYLGILFLGMISVLNGLMMIGMSHMIGSRRPTSIKAMPYESGIDPLGETRERFSVNFYMSRCSSSFSTSRPSSSSRGP